MRLQRSPATPRLLYPALHFRAHEGQLSGLGPDPYVLKVRGDRYEIEGPRELPVIADVGTAAWIDCAGHLPWGLSGDQRLDDARSLTWDVVPPAGPIVGYPVARLRVSASAPAASLSVKLCDVTDGEEDGPETQAEFAAKKAVIDDHEPHVVALPEIDSESAPGGGSGAQVASVLATRVRRSRPVVLPLNMNRFHTRVAAPISER